MSVKYRLRLWQYDFQGGEPGKVPTHEITTDDPVEADAFLGKHDIDDNDTSTTIRLTIVADHNDVYKVLRREIEHMAAKA